MKKKLFIIFKDFGPVSIRAVNAHEDSVFTSCDIFVFEREI